MCKLLQFCTRVVGSYLVFPSPICIPPVSCGCPVPCWPRRVCSAPYSGIAACLPQPVRPLCLLHAIVDPPLPLGAAHVMPCSPPLARCNAPPRHDIPCHAMPRQAGPRELSPANIPYKCSKQIAKLCHARPRVPMPCVRPSACTTSMACCTLRFLAKLS